MNYYFKLKFRRAMRAITGFGVNPFLGLTIGTGIFIWMSIIVFKKVNYPQYFYSFLSLVVITTLSNKSRNDFLKITFFRKKYFIIRIFENLIYSIPFLFFLAYKGEYLVALITIVMSSLFSLITFSGKSALVIPTPFSKRPYEFSIGFTINYFNNYIIHLNFRPQFQLRHSMPVWYVSSLHNILFRAGTCLLCLDIRTITSGIFKKKNKNSLVFQFFIEFIYSHSTNLL
jgi:hypothetical protein